MKKLLMYCGASPCIDLKAINVPELTAFKSIHGLAPQYMSDLATKISQLTSHNLCSIAIDLWLPQKEIF